MGSKRLSHLWEQTVSFDNLLLAYRKARRGKRRKPAVAAFGLKLEWELLKLQEELQSGTYHPGDYRLFTIYERKPRLIAAAEFRERVVHHALMNMIEPPLDKRFISDSYACRPGKGVHQAVARYQKWAGRYLYVLKMDIRQYFPSIDHLLLKKKLARRIKDPKILELLCLIIDTAPAIQRDPVYFPGDDLFTPLERNIGLPIGNLTSQFFANLYLDDFDHYLKEQLRLPAYLRYVDDLFVLDDDKQKLLAVREQVSERLAVERLRLHPCKAHIIPAWLGLDVLGYRVRARQRYLRNDNGHRFARRLRGFAAAYAAGTMTWEDFNPSVQSWIGHARHADTLGLRETLFSAIVFRQGTRDKPAVVARRLLEQ
ncbi:MAG: RNA-dependent DNA polymerase [Gammaproteobacteria bacterium]|nr:RNA-dependent DNA polymerase [Gammaproteobacteria bacterium]